MATEQPVMKITLKAGADLSTHQYKCMKLDTNGDAIVTAGTTDIPVGILQNKPDASGKAAEILVVGVSKVNADASLAIGDMIGTSADGQLAAYVAGTDTTKYIIGRMLDAPGAAGEIGTALINCLNPHRGA